jgi:cell division protein FtsL
MSAHGVAGPGDTAGRPDERPEQPSVRPGQPDLYVVEPRVDHAARRLRRVRLTAVLAGCFVSAVLFGLVGVHVMLAQGQFRLDRLNARSAVEEAKYQRLRLEVDQLEAPQRIVATAEGKLGMVPPAAVRYLTPASRLTSATPAGVGRPAPVPAPPPAPTLAAGAGPRDWAAVKPRMVTSQ